jgi:glycosyltransferase involved in cell wall biosynthesis
LPILEAMANNCPVLCSNRGSLPEIAGDAAIYFNPDSVEDIKSSIENAIYNETCLRLLVKKGISRVKLFSWSNCANKTYKLYQNTI